ncbi:hypothetical protein QAD02_011556 [Eretmocerus hayati]|uniref:Uncharacterized protein n=1 Tax=Eretmocerus hayati TaxID=131215 RepID=A0ACC2NX47_9HYME|nr:hypothetical protein QAD02_011556 [Eretmocerus hayati]
MKIAVLGGGCVGLTTALHLTQELRNTDRIDVVAASFDESITSYVAAGIFRISSAFSAPTDQLTKKWIDDSYNFYESISRSAEASNAGVTNISGYLFSNSSPSEQTEWMKDLVPLYRKATDRELKLVGGNWKYGTFMTTLLTQPNQYLPWARHKLREKGVNFMNRSVESFQELTGTYDIIVNCTGLGSRQLCNDRKLVPIKGHVIKVKAPWLKTFFYGGVETYIIPGTDGTTTLGGNREFESWDKSICPYQIAAIRDRCEKLVPSLKKAEVVKEKTGLRPHREGGVRVEVERIQTGSGRAMIIHNYGHGGYGICAAPGTSKYAVELTKNAHRSTAKL